MSIESSLPREAAPSRPEVLEQVSQILSEFANLPAEEIRETHLLFEDLGLDSLDLVECSMEIEEEFGVSVSDELVEQVKTVGDVADGVMTLLQPADARSG
jgi:acyl carrier protein